jgi:hypothetical protein
MSNLTKISFDVTGSVQQEIEILKEDVTQEQLVEKLNTGEYLTTLEVAHPDLRQGERTVVCFDEDGNEVTIGIILSQTIGEETQYAQFQLEATE